MASLMTVGIRANPAEGTGRGFIRGENNPFSLNVANRAVTLGDKTFTFDPKDVLLQDDDIYVESKLLADWLLVDFEVNLSSLLLTLKPRVPLPLQARLEREAKLTGLSASSGPVDPNYPRIDNPYKLVDVPFVDLTLSVGTQGASGSRSNSAAYTTYVRGDLAGLQASLFLYGSNQSNSQQSRFTVGRNDPQGELLGPLQARSFALGDVSVPSVPNISRGSGTGNGFSVSNVTLDRPTRFDSQALRGDLPPGWDVELFLNNALIAYQQSRADGKYAFEDLSLVYGPNDFRLVFHGPQGQLRVERKSFLLDESLTAPGSFYYSLATNRDTAGLQHTAAAAEWGFSKSITGALGSVNQQAPDGKRTNYTTMGLRGFAANAVFVGNLTRQLNGGSLYELSARTRFGDIAVGWNHLQLNNFTSDTFPLSDDPVRTRDNLRIDGLLISESLGTFPFSTEFRRDRLKSGASALDATFLLSTSIAQASLSNLLHVSSSQGARVVDGAFQIGGNLGSFRVGGQINYLVRPQAKLSGLALSVSRPLDPGSQLNLGANYSFQDSSLQLTASLNKSFGTYAVAVTGGISNRGQYSIGLQVFTGILRDPRRSQWLFDALPQAESGAISARVFADKNGNGIMDADEPPIKGVGFLVNTSTNAARTDEAGIAFVGRLSGNRNIDITVNPVTVEDPQLVSKLKGVRIVPRPGVVTQIDFPLVQTGEIDGTVYLVRNGRKRGVANARIELVDKSGKVVTETRSGSDGFFLMTEVLPGEYSLRIGEQQIQELKLRESGARQVVMSPTGSFLSGQDFSLETLSP
ncbi:MAG: hypothetical protein H7228_12205 [Polaromonas sp.]|nr:hypothetical protein [Polaromonas sp.]